MGRQENNVSPEIQMAPNFPSPQGGPANRPTVSEMSRRGGKPSFYTNVFPFDEHSRRQPFVRGADLDFEFVQECAFAESSRKRVKVAESDSAPMQHLESAAEFYESVLRTDFGGAGSRKRKRPSRAALAAESPEEKTFYCEYCESYAASQEDHCAGASHMVQIAAFSSLPALPSYGIPQTNKGYQILRDKLHWQQDKGLGRDEQGRLFPVPTKVKMARTGLGGESQAEKEERITHLTDPKTAEPVVELTKAQEAQEVPVLQRTRRTIEEKHLEKRDHEARIRRLVRSDLDLLEARKLFS